MKFSTRCIHSDEAHTPDVASPLHVSTTFRYAPEFNTNCAIKRGFIDGELVSDSTAHVYCRDTSETRTRVEKVLGSLENAYAVTYSSGLSAFYALVLHLQPNTVVISKEGYHGTHGALELYKRGRHVTELALEDQTTSSLSSLPPNTLLWLESPQNPRGEVADMLYYKNNIPNHVILGVDATFAPPPIQNLMDYADFVMHSSTKFLGGHSDLLGGVLMTRDLQVQEALIADRTELGAVMGSMETWLLLRSLRTLKVRVMQQSASAFTIVEWLTSNSEPCLEIVKKVWHASLKPHPGHEAMKRQGQGWSGVFSVDFKTPNQARLLCSNTKLFINATSLGGVESKVEWRAAVDSKIDPTLVRVNVGLEDVEDLIEDLRQAFLTITQIK